MLTWIVHSVVFKMHADDSTDGFSLCQASKGDAETSWGGSNETQKYNKIIGCSGIDFLLFQRRWCYGAGVH